PERGVFPELWIAVDDLEGAPPCPLHQLDVVREAGQLQVGHAGLLDVEEGSLPPEPQVLVGELEAVSGPGERVEPGPGLLVLLVALVEEEAGGRVLAASDPATELVELGQPEPLRVLDEHDRGV